MYSDNGMQSNGPQGRVVHNVKHVYDQQLPTRVVHTTEDKWDLPSRRIDVRRDSISNAVQSDYCDSYHDSDNDLRRARQVLKKAEFEVMRTGRAADAVNRLDAAKRYLHEDLHWHGPC
jgi:hypothetical protein